MIAHDRTRLIGWLPFFILSVLVAASISIDLSKFVFKNDAFVG